MKKLMVVGGLPNEKYNCRYGGATVLMKNFKEYLDKIGYKYCFAQTNKYINTKTLELRPIKNKMYFMFYFFTHIFLCDKVMFNFSDHATVYMFPFLCRCAKFLHKKVIFRKFGGSFDIYLSNVSEKKKNVVFGALNKCDLIFLETKSGIKYLERFIIDRSKIHWFPNVRNKSKYVKDEKDYNKKLVFMSHISDEKGVGDLLNVFQMLPSNFQLDIYGAIKEDKYLNFDWKAKNVNYKGQISSSEVIKKLTDYSILLLPSYREGYPGIILEAMSVGLVVISTSVGGIPEIIENGENGVLVEPGDLNALKEAILSISSQNYKMYSENAYRTFEERFDADNVNNRIVSCIENL